MTTTVVLTQTFNLGSGGGSWTGSQLIDRRFFDPPTTAYLRRTSFNTVSATGMRFNLWITPDADSDIIGDDAVAVTLRDSWRESTTALTWYAEHFFQTDNFAQTVQGPGVPSSSFDTGWGISEVWFAPTTDEQRAQFNNIGTWGRRIAGHDGVTYLTFHVPVPQDPDVRVQPQTTLDLGLTATSEISVGLEHRNVTPSATLDLFDTNLPAAERMSVTIDVGVNVARYVGNGLVTPLRAQPAPALTAVATVQRYPPPLSVSLGATWTASISARTAFTLIEEAKQVVSVYVMPDGTLTAEATIQGHDNRLPIGLRADLTTVVDVMTAEATIEQATAVPNLYGLGPGRYRLRGFLGCDRVDDIAGATAWIEVTVGATVLTTTPITFDQRSDLKQWHPFNRNFRLNDNDVWSIGIGCTVQSGDETTAGHHLLDLYVAGLEVVLRGDGTDRASQNEYAYIGSTVINNV